MGRRKAPSLELKLIKMSASPDTLTVVICQCCEYQFIAEVEPCKQDIDIGYVCEDCYIQLKWAGAHLKVAGLPKCSKSYEKRGQIS